MFILAIFSVQNIYGSDLKRPKTPNEFHSRLITPFHSFLIKGACPAFM